MLKNSYALLTIENLPQMDKKQIKKLTKWLRNCADKIDNEDKKTFASPLSVQVNEITITTTPSWVCT